MCCSKPRAAERRAFSLVEVMVVIVIIGLLAGTATVSVRSYLIRSKQNVAKSELAKFVQALETYYAEYDRYPTTDEGLNALAEPSESFADGLLATLPNDPWGNPYEYLNPGRNSPYEVLSYGADGREGGTNGDQDFSTESLGDR